MLARRTKPPFVWSFPGGAIEPGESAEQAAIREAMEEISTGIEIFGLAGTREVTIRNDKGEIDRRYVISVFAAKLVSGEPKSGPEASEVGWFAPEEIEALDTTEGLAEAAAGAWRVIADAKS